MPKVLSPYNLHLCTFIFMSSSILHNPTFIACQDTQISQTCYNNAWSCPFSQGLFQKDHLQAQPLIADYPKQALLVCIMQGWCSKYLFCWWRLCIADSVFKCTASVNDLNSGQYVCQSQLHNELLFEEFELDVLWDEYRLVGDIIICVFFTPYCGTYILINF